jgi:ABC-type molybdate transport system ATPase subunit
VPEFDSSYREARRAAFGQSVARLQQASGAAVTTLLKVMVDPTTPASTKVRAADSVLNHTAKAIELDDVEARLTELERANEASKEMKKAK